MVNLSYFGGAALAILGGFMIIHFGSATNPGGFGLLFIIVGIVSVVIASKFRPKDKQEREMFDEHMRKYMDEDKDWKKHIREKK